MGVESSDAECAASQSKTSSVNSSPAVWRLHSWLTRCVFHRSVYMRPHTRTHTEHLLEASRQPLILLQPLLCLIWSSTPNLWFPEQASFLRPWSSDTCEGKAIPQGLTSNQPHAASGPQISICFCPDDPEESCSFLQPSLIHTADTRHTLISHSPQNWSNTWASGLTETNHQFEVKQWFGRWLWR